MHSSQISLNSDTMNMIPFRAFFESYKSVDEFMSSPDHKDKDNYNWIKGLEQDGGKVLGRGSYGSVYSHPKWPYVVKVFSDDVPYLRYTRLVNKYSDEFPAFPKFYGKAMKYTPPYSRSTTSKDYNYAIRMEKLYPFQGDMDTLKDIQDLSYDWQMVDAWEDPKTRERYLKNWSEENLKDAYQRAKQRVSVSSKLSEVGRALAFISKNIEASLDIHGGNFMHRENGDIVIVDPVWEGTTPMKDAADHARLYDMADYPDPPLVKGGKMPSKYDRNKKRKERRRVKQLKTDIMLDDEIPF